LEKSVAQLKEALEKVKQEQHEDGEAKESKDN